MRQRLSGWVGAAILVVAGAAACGSRDDLLVGADEAPVSGGTFGHSGSASSGGVSGLGSGGRAGKASGGSIGKAGAGAAGNSFGGFGGAGVGGTGFAGVTGNAFGGSAGFAGSAIGGFAGVGGSFDCSSCSQSNTECLASLCDPVHRVCLQMAQNDGQLCKPNTPNLCAGTSVCQNGQCVATAQIVCAMADECTSASCDPKTGKCVQTPLTGPPCTLANPDPCVMGQCFNGLCGKASTIASCLDNDKCCPANCTSVDDNDCMGLKQITLTTSDRGWYEANGAHDAGNKNTFTGFSPPQQYNSFFVFDLSTVTQTITAAQLSLKLEHYYGTDMSETISIWDVTTPASQVSTGSGPAIYQDLQSGTSYATVTVTAGAVTQPVPIPLPLSGQAVTALNAARGKSFVLGLHLDTLSGQTGMDEGVRFSMHNEAEPNQLVLTVQ